MRVLFSSTSGLGHIFPMVPLARAFTAGGHEVLWATGGDASSHVADAGLDVVPAGLSGQSLAELVQRLRAKQADVPPEARAALMFPRMFGQGLAPTMFADLLPLARGWRPDLLVHEQGELAAPLVGAMIGVPSVTHSFGGAVPADFVEEAGRLLAPLWSEHGQSIPPHAGCFTSTYLDICPPRVQSVSMGHVGDVQPLRPVTYTGEPTTDLPAFLREDDRPLVYLTLGTVMNQAAVLSAAAASLAGLGVRILVTVGPNGDPAALGRQPSHVTVERYVSQTDVLPRCTAVVSHAGSGTFLGALGHGLPQLCLPQAADQFRNAEGPCAAVRASPCIPNRRRPRQSPTRRAGSWLRTASGPRRPAWRTTSAPCPHRLTWSQHSKASRERWSPRSSPWVDDQRCHDCWKASTSSIVSASPAVLSGRCRTTRANRRARPAG